LRATQQCPLSISLLMFVKRCRRNERFSFLGCSAERIPSIARRSIPLRRLSIKHIFTHNAGVIPRPTVHAVIRTYVRTYAICRNKERAICTRNEINARTRARSIPSTGRQREFNKSQRGARITAGRIKISIYQESHAPATGSTGRCVMFVIALPPHPTVSTPRCIFFVRLLLRCDSPRPNAHRRLGRSRFRV